MKRLGGVWQQLVSFENLLLAYRKARRGKSRRPSVAGFECNLEKELLQLQRELQSGEYLPGDYRLFTLYERKPRQISAAPFRDRVVHHAIMNVIEATLDRSFIDDSYACRHGKGTHAAVDKYQQWAHRYIRHSGRDCRNLEHSDVIHDSRVRIWKNNLVFIYSPVALMAHFILA